MQATPELQILLPVHNEAESIAATIGEIYEELSPIVQVEFLLCEDGSKDNTKQVLRKVAQAVPAKLLLSDERKGYSRAVRDGMMETEAPFLLCLDSDGQCDPKDFRTFWENRGQADVLIRMARAPGGYRTAKNDVSGILCNMEKIVSGTHSRSELPLYTGAARSNSQCFEENGRDARRLLVGIFSSRQP